MFVLQGGLGASQVSWFRIAGGSLSPPVSGQQAQGIRVPATQPYAGTAGAISSADGAVPGLGAPISIVGLRGLDRPAFGERVRVPSSPGVVTRSPVKPIQARNLLFGEGRK